MGTSQSKWHSNNKTHNTIVINQPRRERMATSTIKAKNYAGALRDNNVKAIDFYMNGSNLLRVRITLENGTVKYADITTFPKPIT